MPMRAIPRVAPLGPVQRERRDAVGDLDADLLVVHALRPPSCCLQQVGLHLVVGVPRQRRDELDAARPLEAREPRAGERAERVAVERGAVAPHDDRRHLLAPARVRRADDRDVGDVGVRAQHRLDLGRRHVLAAGDDEVLHAPGDEEVAVGVAAAEVAGVEPAVADRRRGRGGVAVVARITVGPPTTISPSSSGAGERAVGATDRDVHEAGSCGRPCPRARTRSCRAPCSTPSVDSVWP